jgi:enoyl-CoA hydratase/carnithine racemase
MAYREIAVEEVSGGVVIRLNRPQHMNAYTPDMGEELVDALRQYSQHETVSSIIITGTGDAFCAGADRDFLRGNTARCGLKLGEESFIRNFSEEFAALPCVTIAAFNGTAVGIGITAMLAADIRLAVKDARLILNFAELGILPGLGASYFLPRLLGQAKATELLLCQREISGVAAAELGLVNQSLDASELLPTALAMAERSAQCKPGMIDAIKQSLRAGCDSDLAGALTFERNKAQALRQ